MTIKRLVLVIITLNIAYVLTVFNLNLNEDKRRGWILNQDTRQYLPN